MHVSGDLFLPQHGIRIETQRPAGGRQRGDQGDDEQEQRARSRYVSGI